MIYLAGVAGRIFSEVNVSDDHLGMVYSPGQALLYVCAGICATVELEWSEWAVMPVGYWQALGLQLV
jgi:hypothetical protein